MTPGGDLTTQLHTGSGPVDCTQAVKDLYNFLDGELTQDKRDAIRAHLDLCPPCAGAAHFETELRHVIADKYAESVPDDLKGRILAALNDTAAEAN